MARGDECRLVTYVGYVGTRESRSLACQQVNVELLVHLYWLQVYLEDFTSLVKVGQVHVYLTVKASCAQQGLVKHIHAVCCGKDYYTRVSAKAVHLCQQGVERVLALIVAAKAWVLATGTSYGVNLINEDDRRCLVFCLAEGVAYA